eukprot:c3654_g1_i2.p1 GENE.c3654_g1_i2~~c3654_g1_i2.p1  ORF type:complete len:147 (+),score=38.68 c3654_g1_i2:19-459(+)
MRVKFRILVCEVVWEKGTKNGEIQSSVITTAVKNSVLLNFGEIFFGKVKNSIAMRYWNQNTNIFMLRVPREGCQEICASLTLINKLLSSQMFIRTIHTSGKLDTAIDFMIEYDQQVKIELRTSKSKLATTKHIETQDNQLNKLRSQ